jgi:hypothetical protein
MNKNEQRRQARMNRINSNLSPKVVLIDDSGNELNLFIYDIRRYRAIDVPEDRTLIEMNSGVEHRVIHAFDDVDRLIDRKLNP